MRRRDFYEVFVKVCGESPRGGSVDITIGIWTGPPSTGEVLAALPDAVALYGAEYPGVSRETLEGFAEHATAHLLAYGVPTLPPGARRTMFSVGRVSCGVMSGPGYGD